MISEVEYRALTARFDALWAVASGEADQGEMRRLLALIDPYERVFGPAGRRHEGRADAADLSRST
ncbi:hypothetical protein [Caldimonas brevitalea]|uniref:hypothetical protein n=1 Tax=Caldimonas brevitalea TaxID=413882 RepID=UPI001470859A|nr:hypothetical protein [Caldimonas brevitalea]